MPEIVAELCSNPVSYHWDLTRFVTQAAMTGAKNVKIQVFRAEHFPEWEQAGKRAAEFPRERLREFAELAHANGMKAGASVFDAEAVELCARELDFLKLAAREQYNFELAFLVCNQNKPVYRSISEFGAWGVAGTSTRSMDATLWAIQSYPAPMLLSLYGVTRAALFFGNLNYSSPRWGWSSHTRGWLDCLLAARFGASVIEKHFCLSHDDIEGGHSLTSDEFGRMVERCRH